MGRFSEETVIYWMGKICDVLHYLHSQEPNPIIFRDIKPSNIMIDKKGNLKLIDFGIAREFKEEALTDTVSIGTRGYAAPEQYGLGQTNACSDIYSLGATVYHLLTGKSPTEAPFEMKMLRSLDPSFSEAVEYIVFKCTRPNPQERYQSVLDIHEDIQKYYKVANLDGQDDLEKTDGTGTNAAINKVQHKTFKRQIISVLGNHEFGCELAYVTAKLTDLTVLLVNLDFTASKADLTLNLVPEMDRLLKQGTAPFGFFPVQKAMKKNNIQLAEFNNYCIKKEGLNNFFILTDIHDVENYEKYREFNLDVFLDFCYRNFDLTVVLVNSAIQDIYNKTPMRRADINMIAVPPNLETLREMEGKIQYFEKHDALQMNTVRLVGFEYKKEIHLPEHVCKQFFGVGSFLGTINYDQQREECRNLDSYYAKIVLKFQSQEYQQILQQLDIMPKPTLGDKISGWLTALVKK